jgi:2,5-furandicarboxylate decarboxylase 1
MSMDLGKLTIVTDDDVDIYNMEEVERALRFRVRPDKDVIIISGTRGKPLDSSLGVIPGAVLALESAIGIDATIPEGVSKLPYERLRYTYLDEVKLEDYLAEGKRSPKMIEDVSAKEVEELSAKVLDMLTARPLYFYDLLTGLRDVEYRKILLAFGRLRAKGVLTRDEAGRYLPKDTSTRVES